MTRQIRRAANCNNCQEKEVCPLFVRTLPPLPSTTKGKKFTDEQLNNLIRTIATEFVCEEHKFIRKQRRH